jgi:hypothetical protein
MGSLWREHEEGAAMSATEQPSRVTVVFETAALAFNLPRGATLAQLAEELAELGELCGGSPLYVDVHLAA